MLFLWREPTVNMFSFSRGCHVVEPERRPPMYTDAERDLQAMTQAVR